MGRTLSVLLSIVLVTQTAWTAPPPTYFAKPIRGVVADAGTGKPLGGVIVVAQWVLYNRGLGKRREILHSFETVTNQDGHYTIPGWGPKRTPSPHHHILEKEAPGLTFFKPGYRPRFLTSTQEQATGERVSEWDGKTIKLEPSREGHKECAELFLWQRLLEADDSVAYAGSSRRIRPAVEAAVKKVCAAGPPMYSAKPIQANVEDAETGRPLEGVIVVAQWVLFQIGVGHPPGHRERIQVLETVTDQDGHYVFPGWGPKRSKSVLHFLTTRDPEILFFKPGYMPFGVENRRKRDDAVRFSEWDGKTIKLERFTGTPEEWARQLGFRQTSLAWGDVMEWQLVPRMTLAILEERERVPRKLRYLVSSSASLGTTQQEVRRFLESQNDPSRER